MKTVRKSSSAFTEFRASVNIPLFRNWSVFAGFVGSLDTALTMLDPGEGLTNSVTEESRSLPELLELYTHSITSVGLSLTERVML